MARHWREEFNPAKHRNPMRWDVPPLASTQAPDRLVDSPVFFVAVCGFTFEFHGVDQILACRDYYAERIHPSSSLDVRGGDHWEYQRWFERLPGHLREEPKRLRVIKALDKALTAFSSQGDGCK